jgi:hypothetical protein
MPRLPSAHPRARAGVRARAWGSVAVVGENQGARGKGAVGPSPGGERRPVRPEGQALPQGKGAGFWRRWADGAGQEDQVAAEARSDGIRRPIVSAARIVGGKNLS